MRTFVVNRVFVKTQAIKNQKVYKLNLSCKDCMYSRDIYMNVTPNHLTRKNICILFRNNIEHDPYVETGICRSDRNLCGEDGEYFKSKHKIKPIDL
jgi:hypothetical protein